MKSKILKFLSLIKLFEFLGSASKFESIIIEIGASTQLSHLNLVGFSNFVLFEYQIKFINQLANFQNLKHLRIEHQDFHISENFIAIISALKELTYIKISTKKVDKALFKNNSFNNLNKVIF